MAAFGADTSVMVAAVSDWHDSHRWALSALEQRLAKRHALLIAAHSLFECYAVLTRLPPPHRLAPDIALTLVDNFSSRAKVVGLSPKACRSLLRRAPEMGFRGGRTYDAVIAASLEQGGATEIVTLNEAHFHGLVGDGVATIAP